MIIGPKDSSQKSAAHHGHARYSLTVYHACNRGVSWVGRTLFVVTVGG